MHHDYENHLRLLSRSQIGDLILAIFEYEKNGTLPAFTGKLEMAFSFIKINLDLDREKYEKTVERNRSNGKSGGRPPNEKPKKPTGLSGFPEKPKKANTNTSTNTNKEKDILTDIQKEPEWDSFVAMRKQIKKPLTGRAVSMAIGKLEELAPGNLGEQKKILDQSTYHCWQGLFSLKSQEAQDDRTRVREDPPPLPGVVRL